MKLSSSQVHRFWREWSASCKAMNWTRQAGLNAADIDSKRKDILKRCGFDSLTDVDRVDGFTNVLNELLVLQRIDLNAAREADDLSINQQRVWLNVILSETIPCLELYVQDVQAYLNEILTDKNRWWKIQGASVQITLLDLSLEQLKQTQYTLTARLNEKRKAAEHSIHTMKLAAHVACKCARCKSGLVLHEVHPVHSGMPF